MLRPDDIPLGKRGSGVGIFAHEKLATSVIDVPYLESHNRIIWLRIQPKRLPRRINGLTACAFYYWLALQTEEKVS